MLIWGLGLARLGNENPVVKSLTRFACAVAVLEHNDLGVETSAQMEHPTAKIQKARVTYELERG